MSEQKKDESTSTRVVVGRVVSTKMQKTITILVERQWRHPKYGKTLRRTSKLHAHDENNVCNIGDLVSVKEVRRLSATKNWQLVAVLDKAAVADAAAGTGA